MNIKSFDVLLEKTKVRSFICNMDTLMTRILEKPAHEVAILLLGSILERELNGSKVRVRIVETEAYDESDAASHSFKGRTERTDVMFGEPGHLYVYFTYGMHYCCNVVTGKAGEGAAVLIRAVEPIEGEWVMQENRPVSGVQLSNGPAKLCQALGINKQLNGHNLTGPPLKLILSKPLAKDRIVQAERIGIKQAKDVPWRFYIKDNSYVSKI
jgi:DNA-3-methyladenine glycosylase